MLSVCIPAWVYSHPDTHLQHQENLHPPTPPQTASHPSSQAKANQDKMTHAGKQKQVRGDASTGEQPHFHLYLFPFFVGDLSKSSLTAFEYFLLCTIPCMSFCPSFPSPSFSISPLTADRQMIAALAWQLSAHLKANLLSFPEQKPRPDSIWLNFGTFYGDNTQTLLSYTTNVLAGYHFNTSHVQRH